MHSNHLQNNDDSLTESHSPSESNQGLGEVQGESSQTAAAANRPGRKKNPNSVAARRDQNRIAQREFRLRKQQRIRDLEAHVQILLSSRDDGYQELKLIIGDLIKENASLRSLVKDLSGFLGAGEGGFVDRMGLDWEEFSKFVDKADTDTAFESFASRRNASKSSETQEQGRKRQLNGESSSLEPPSKRLNSGAALQTHNDELDHRSPLPLASPPLSGPWDSPLAGLEGAQGLHNLLDLRPSSLHPMIPGPSHLEPTAVPTLPPYSDHCPPTQPPMSHIRPASPPQMMSGDRMSDMKIQEAIKLVRYHLDNYRRNDAYCLPISLRPSLVQRTVPHESMIDELVNPDLRDSMILLRGRYDLVECLHLASSNLEVHGEDVLAHHNWEFKEPWLRTYSFLVEQPLLNVCNRWRKERGEHELTLHEIRSDTRKI